ncbi:MAG: hypothetical protein ACLR9U_08675 [Lachnospira sp.]
MGAYNVKEIKFLNQIQIKVYNKPIEFDNKKVRANERKKENKERTQQAIDLSIRQSMNRTKNSIWQIALSNKWDYFVTFTFNPKLVKSNDYNEVSFYMSNWLDNARRRCSPDMKYLIVPEYHKDKQKFHFHALMSNINGITLVDSGYRSNNKIIFNIANYHLGFTTAIPIDIDKEGQNKTCGYMLKYITKDLINLSQGKRRYWYSIKNCDKPQIDNYIVESEQLSGFIECLENDMNYRKKIDMPFCDNELRIYNFET